MLVLQSAALRPKVMLIFLVARDVRSSVRRTVYWLWYRPSNTIQSNHHAKHRAADCRNFAVPGVYHDYPARLLLGEPGRNIEVLDDLHRTMVCEFVASWYCKSRYIYGTLTVTSRY